jgi:rhodanese-related sulfurtransferase
VLNPDKTDEISPEKTKRLHLNGEATLVDCREEDEFAFCRIEGAHLVPLSEFGEKVFECVGDDREKLTIIYCHHGIRSLQATYFLRQRGYKNVYSMTGGIEAWSDRVDPRVAKY